MYQWQDSNGEWHTEQGTRDDYPGQNGNPNDGTTPSTSGQPATRNPQSSLDPNVVAGDRRTGASPDAQQVSSQNFDWDGSGTGAQDDIFQDQLANDAAQQRKGVVIDNYDANEQFANALKARQNQQYLGGLYKAQLTGQGPSAANLGGQASLDAAIAAQHGAGLGASYGGGNSMLASNAQFAGARGQEVGAAAAGFGGNAQTMRGGDLSTMGLQQQQAYRQAQLEAEQRKRNDQMAQFYVNQQNQIAAQQLHAREAYQAQRDASALQAQGLYNQQQQRRQQQSNQTYLDVAQLASSLMGGFGSGVIDYGKKVNASGDESGGSTPDDGSGGGSGGGAAAYGASFGV